MKIFLILLSFSVFRAQAFASESLLISRIQGTEAEPANEAIQLVCLTKTCKITRLKNGGFVAKTEVSHAEATKFFKQAKTALKQPLSESANPLPNNLVELSFEKKTVSVHGFNPAILAMEEKLQARLSK